MPRFSASMLTCVGLTRVSIGPPISVMDARRVRVVLGFHRATAAITGTEGWQTAITCTSGPEQHGA